MKNWRKGSPRLWREDLAWQRQRTVQRGRDQEGCSNPLTFCELPGPRWCLGELWLLLASSTSPSGSPGQGEAGEEEARVLVPIGSH